MWPALKQGSGSQQQGRTAGSSAAVIDGTPAPREGESGDTNPVKEFLARQSAQPGGRTRFSRLGFIGKGPAPEPAQQAGTPQTKQG